MTAEAEPAEEFDIIIIGAGLSGINAAYRVQKELPHRSYAILERRHEIGGTWSFWKYPGIRTDSAMGLFGFPWRPWPYDNNMATAQAIRTYMEECAASEGIDRHIRFGHRVASAAWRSNEQRWTLTVVVTHKDGSVATKTVKAWWLICASGYYSYDKPLPAVIPGLENFEGQVIHPQFWDESINYDGKRIIIIGSGATAITLLPALAKTAQSVTMLQRSPTYVMSLPRRDSTLQFLCRFLPRSWAAAINWWNRMIVETLFVKFLLTFPNISRAFLMSEMRRQLPAGFDVETHFNPRYNPFQQRLCFCPGGDFFKALHRPNARVVTDVIDTVTATGIRLKSGAFLEADMIVTATGLYFNLFDGLDITIDGELLRDSIADRYIWNGSMLEGVPNAGLIVGYTAATWTPGADVRVRQMIKVMKYMERSGAVEARPWLDPKKKAKLPANPAVDLTSTYMVTAHNRMPRNAGKGPWMNGASWAADVFRLWFGSVRSGMRYVFAPKDKKE